MVAAACRGETDERRRNDSASDLQIGWDEGPDGPEIYKERRRGV